MKVAKYDVTLPLIIESDNTKCVDPMFFSKNLHGLDAKSVNNSGIKKNSKTKSKPNGNSEVGKEVNLRLPVRDFQHDYDGVKQIHVGINEGDKQGVTNEKRGRTGNWSESNDQ